MLLAGSVFSDHQTSTFAQISHQNSAYAFVAYNGFTDMQSVYRQHDLLGLLIAGDAHCNPAPGLGMLLTSGKLQDKTSTTG